MKNKKWIITLIILLSIIMIALSIFFVNLLQGNFKFKGFRFGLQSSNELILDKTYEESFNKIIVDATTSEIYIKKSNVNKVQAIIYGNKDFTKVDTVDNSLTVKTSDKNCIGFCFNKKSAKIEIYLPENYNGNIDIKNDYGDIFIDEFLNAFIDIKEDCGNVEIVGGNIIEVENNYGDIEIRKANIASIFEDCGDVDISNVNEVTAKNSYGDINIKSVEGYLHLENDCGDIEIDNINLKKNSYIKDDFGDIEIENTNKIFIDAKTDLGSIEIKNNYNKSDITLKIENDCGDILVGNN